MAFIKVEIRFTALWNSFYVNKVISLNQIYQFQWV